MKKIILKESDLTSLILRILKEQSVIGAPNYGNALNLPNINPKNLKFGDGGKKDPTKARDVRILQQKLFDLGLLKTKSGVPTGYFGNLTQRALETYYKGSKGIPTVKSPSTKKSQVIPSLKQQSKKVRFTPRIDAELNYIKKRGLNDRPFFIYDPKDNLLYLFDKNSLIDYTSVVDGKSQQKQGKVYTYEDWCRDSGFNHTPGICTVSGVNSEKQCKSIDKAVWKGSYCHREPIYSKLPEANRFFPKGIYDIRGLFRTEGYVGAGLNNFRVYKTGTKDLLPASIHGIPKGSQERLNASSDLEAGLKKDLETGKVPEKYLQNTKAIAAANQSFGCVGVPATFVDNPKVQQVANGARLFVMGDDQNFLVQNANTYFEKLAGDGENCVNPKSLANKMQDVA